MRKTHFCLRPWSSSASQRWAAGQVAPFGLRRLPVFSCKSLSCHFLDDPFKLELFPGNEPGSSFSIKAGALLLRPWAVLSQNHPRTTPAHIFLYEWGSGDPELKEANSGTEMHWSPSSESAWILVEKLDQMDHFTQMLPCWCWASAFTLLQVYTLLLWFAGEAPMWHVSYVATPAHTGLLVHVAVPAHAGLEHLMKTSLQTSVWALSCQSWLEKHSSNIQLLCLFSRLLLHL